MIDSEGRDGVRSLTLDRPDRRNALTPAALEDLVAAVEAPAEPVVCLQGAGEAFCAGADPNAGVKLAWNETANFAPRGQDVTRVAVDVPWKASLRPAASPTG